MPNKSYALSRPTPESLLAALKLEFSISTDMTEYIEDLKGELDSSDEPVYFITDATHLKMNFTDLVSILGLATKPKDGFAIMMHPNIKQTIVISDNNLIEFGVNSLGQSQYGKIEAYSFPTLDEALAHIKNDKHG